MDAMLQGFVVMGVGYYLQAWCVEMKGPVFLAAWTPFCFIFTIFCSSFFLGEIVNLGRYANFIIEWVLIFEKYYVKMKNILL
jgi:hypothetical protein